MSTPTDTLKDIEAISLSLLQDEKLFLENENRQLNDQVRMLEQEIDRQSTIIDALVKAIRVIERG